MDSGMTMSDNPVSSFRFRIYAQGMSVNLARLTINLKSLPTRLIRRNMSLEPKVLSKTQLKTEDAKWVTLKKITWQDQDGKEVSGSRRVYWI